MYLTNPPPPLIVPILALITPRSGNPLNPDRMLHCPNRFHLAEPRKVRHRNHLKSPVHSMYVGVFY